LTTTVLTIGNKNFNISDITDVKGTGVEGNLSFKYNNDIEYISDDNQLTISTLYILLKRLSKKTKTKIRGFH
jgi:hypothetical protein